MTIIKTKINATLRMFRANHAPELEREIQRLIDMGAPTTVHEKIAERVAFSENKFLLDGVESVAVYEWGRDCDQCEGDSVCIIPANFSTFKKKEHEMYMNAEGPCHMRTISKKDHSEFEASFRDRRAPQYNY